MTDAPTYWLDILYARLRDLEHAINRRSWQDVERHTDRLRKAVERHERETYDL